ncbi:AraC family transcriptional regulator [Paenibacillus wynnii]|uniref:AraC family transcriptional regulator n=1 Tax=Paenibacillus wynnii TaxID=268407 RepID=UPI00279310EB|nr:AraC family transcriptional regulator [Paenibacillus wynnii]MDQ0194170.1 AraC-like DNA-binding protein [Paenibacillus wynnii]
MHQMSVMLGIPIVHSIESRGHSIVSLYKDLQIHEDLMTNPDNYIDSDKYDRLLESAAHICKDPYFGLLLGSGFSLDNLGLIGYILLNSNTLKQAFENYQRYNILLCSGVVYDLQIINGEAKFSFWVSDSSRNPTYHLMDSILSSTYKIIQKLTGDPLPLNMVLFTHNAPSDIQPYANLFGTKLVFNQKENALIFDAKILDLPVLYRNQQLLEIVENHAIQMIRALKLEQTFSEIVSLAIIKRFDGSIPRIQDIARGLGFSVRSIQLQLKKDNTTFKDLLTLIRKNMAERYLKDPSFSISDISYALGFSEPVSFHLAFKKWTGQTPGGYRKQNIG